MQVKDLKPRSPVEMIELEVISKEEPRDFTSRYGGSGRVCKAVGKDESGEEVTITLWNDEIDTVPVDSKIRLKNGWVKEWNGKLELSAGKYGELEVL